MEGLKQPLPASWEEQRALGGRKRIVAANGTKDRAGDQAEPEDTLAEALRADIATG